MDSEICVGKMLVRSGLFGPQVERNNQRFFMSIVAQSKNRKTNRISVDFISDCV